ncbi:hypothetical protein POM88_010474 [Heracleum sosnowskyi]|uniref:tryptophan--tRNA ligase n=1 Tax=Heracleum sosnowskyi TaxID=360622 RepID=A0AAD8IUH1_9APIA|nr:hypothetical protein POM88_010474 [Heracleum sosnowskyi]
MVRVGDCVTVNKILSICGFTAEDHIGNLLFPLVQASPSFSSSFLHLFPAKDSLRCLIPCTIDQDPYFRTARDVAPRLGYQKPTLIESKSFHALQGEKGKMSASDPNSALYMIGSGKDIKTKIFAGDAFKVPLVIQVTDEEKCIFKDISVLSRGEQQIVSHLFSNTLQILSICGFTAEDHIGNLLFPLVQASPSFSSSFLHLFPAKDSLRCLIPCTIDQVDQKHVQLAAEARVSGSRTTSAPDFGQTVKEGDNTGAEAEQIVTPYKVDAQKKIDYDKIIDKFGCQRVDESLI